MEPFLGADPISLPSLVWTDSWAPFFVPGCPPGHPTKQELLAALTSTLGAPSPKNTPPLKKLRRGRSCLSATPCIPNTSLLHSSHQGSWHVCVISKNLYCYFFCVKSLRKRFTHQLKCHLLREELPRTLYKVAPATTLLSASFSLRALITTDVHMFVCLSVPPPPAAHPGA